MNKSLLIILLFGFSATFEAQVTLRDSVDWRPIWGAVVNVVGKENSEVLVSDADGKIFPNLKGEVELQISAVGYKTKIKTVNLETLEYVDLQPLQFVIDKVVVTGQFEEKREEDAVQKITVIGRSEIDRIQAVTLRDVLLFQNNLNINQDLALGTTTKLLGLSGSQVKILINGVPVIGRLDGNIDLDQINLDNVLRIEIVEGPMSVEYGTDALAGAINIITKKSVFKNSYGARLLHETAGRTNTSAFAELQMGKAGVQLNLGRNFFDGFSASDQDRIHQWKPKEQYFSEVNVNRSFGKLDLSFRSNAFYEILDDFGPIFYQNELIPVNDSISDLYAIPFASDSRYTTLRLDNTLRVSINLDTLNSIKAHVAYNFYERERYTYNKNLTTLEESITLDPEELDTTAFDLVNSRGKWNRRMPGINSSLQLGYEFQNESSRGKRIEDDVQSMRDIAGFVSAEFGLTERFILRPGLRWIDNSQYDAPLIPSLHMQYKLKDWNFRASFGRGFRAPSLKELYFFFVDSNHNIRGTSDLKAEIADNYQVSASFSNLADQWLYKSSLTVFYNKVDNLIDLALIDTETQLYNYVNLSEVETRGINFNVEAVHTDLKVSAGLTWLEVKNGLGLEGAKYFGTLQGRLAAFYIWSKPGITFNYQFNYRGKERVATIDENEELSYVENQDYSLSSFFIEKDLFKDRVKATVGVNNLFDVTFINTSFSNSGVHTGGGGQIPVGMGRSLLFSIQLKL